MACLSRAGIEALTQPIIRQYKACFVPPRHLCYHVEPEKLAQLLGLAVQTRSLSPDGSILGLTSSGEIGLCLPDGTGGEELVFLDGRTILIEQDLTCRARDRGRLHFTLAHEIGHQLVYRLEGGQPRVSSFRRERPKIRDWAEWQADALAAALLMPRDALEEAMFFYGLGEKIPVLSRKYAQNRYESFCLMADFLQVSRQALAYRMEQLGLVQRIADL